MTTTRQEYLEGLGLPADGETLAKAKPAPRPAAPQADEDVNEHLIPVSDIVFTADMVDGFDLETQLAAASRALFERFKSPRKDKERHSLLHRRISEFLSGLRMERRTGGFVKERVQTTTTTRALAAMLETAGVTPEQLLELLRKEQAGQ